MCRSQKLNVLSSSNFQRSLFLMSTKSYLKFRTIRDTAQKWVGFGNPLFVPPILTFLRADEGRNFKRFSLKMLRCEARVFPVGTAIATWSRFVCMRVFHGKNGRSRFVFGRDKLHKTCERASEICERTLHRQEQTECAWQA